METYYKVKSISALFPEKDVYAFGILSQFLKSIFLFICLVLLPVIFLMSRLEFTSENVNWILEIMFIGLVFWILTGVFFLLIKMQTYFYRLQICQDLHKTTQLQLNSPNSLFSFQYALLFDFAAQKVVLCNHYKKVYLVKNFSDIMEWRIRQKNSLGIERQLFNLFDQGMVYFYMQAKEQEKHYMFAFRLRKKEAQKWGELLGENASLM